MTPKFCIIIIGRLEGKLMSLAVLSSSRLIVCPVSIKVKLLPSDPHDLHNIVSIIVQNGSIFIKVEAYSPITK